jgi:hypothetical protein
MTIRQLPIAGLILACSIYALSSTAALAAQPMAPTPLCVDDKCTDEKPSVVGKAVKWHPGHYLWITGYSFSPSWLSTFKSEVDSFCSNDKIQGVQLTIAWSSLEGAKDDYSNGFNYVDQILAKLKSCNKRLMMGFKYSDFGPIYTTTPTSAWMLPSYLTSSSEYKGSSPVYGVAYSPPGVYWAGSLRMIARVWEPAVMDRLIAMKKAYGARYNKDPAVEMISAGETAIGAPPETGFSYSAYIPQLKRAMSAYSAAWPNTLLRLPANFTGSSSQMQELFDHCRSLGNCGVGGPDPELPLPEISRTVQANRLFRGLDGGTDMRGQIPWIGEQQDLGVLSSVKMCCESISDVANYQKSTMHNSYQIWVKRGETLPTLLKYLADDGSVYLNSCPTKFTGGCNKD